MATDVQVALQLQAGQDPAAALTAAAAKLVRASLETLIQQAGQPLAGKIIAPPPNLPPGLAQIAVADQILTLKLSLPLPTGTPVRIDVQQTATGHPTVTVQQMPSPPVVQAAQTPVPRAPTPLPLPPVVQPAQASATPPSQGPAPAQVVGTTPTAPPPSSQPATPTAQVQPHIAAQTPVAPPTVAQPVVTPAPQTVATAQPLQASMPSTSAGALAPQQMPVQTVVSPAPAAVSQQAPQPTPTAPAQVAAAAPATVTSGPSPAVHILPPAPAAALPPAPPVVTSAPTPPPVSAPSASAPLPAAPGPTTVTAAASAQPQPPLPVAPQPQTAAPPQVLMQRLTQAFAPPPAAATPAPAPGSPAQLVMAAATQAAAQQQSPAPLMQALAVRLPHLPAPVAEAATRVLANRVSLDRGAPTGDALKQAVLRSGVFLDAPVKTGAQPDLRQALTQLRGTLMAWLGDEIAPVAPVIRRPSPPPTRGAMPRGQAPELPQAPEGSAKEAGKALLSQTEGALARVKLMQLSTQGAEAARPGAAAAAPSEWNLELPMMLGHELAMAQVQIARDGKNKADPKDKNWRLRFALKFSVLGEVGAQVTMVGTRASVAIWADEDATAEMLESMLPELAPALTAKGLDLVSLSVRRGVPRDESQPAGRLMDSVR